MIAPRWAKPCLRSQTPFCSIRLQPPQRANPAPPGACSPCHMTRTTPLGVSAGLCVPRLPTGTSSFSYQATPRQVMHRIYRPETMQLVYISCNYIEVILASSQRLREVRSEIFLSSTNLNRSCIRFFGLNILSKSFSTCL